MKSLWGDEFVIEDSAKQAKSLLKKIEKPKKTEQQVLKSKNTSIEDKLRIIYNNVNRILGVYKENTLVIKDKETLSNYIDKAIENNIIAIDTETNNSLDPITCKIMGGCIYTPGCKNAYIPINHTTLTGERLDWQITENQLAEQFSRLIEAKTDIIMHNGKFDYEVIKCTCNCELNIYWDTLIAAKVLNENELAGLKEQYISKIDSTQEKYDIENLFEHIKYEIVPPEVFALYAATDSYMTYKLYLWQKEQFNKPGNERLYSLFMNVEMPVVQVAAEMELTGIEIDTEYANRLSIKYHKILDDLDVVIAKELDKYKDIIAKWRLTDEATYRPPKKQGDGFAKSKSEQLASPPQLTSPTQLAILFYDVLKVGVIDKKNPRGTGEDILVKIQDKYPLCKLILEKRGLEKLINTYIDKIPQCVCKKDGRLHAHFNQYGAGTGRFSSSEPNLQNIPSHLKSIRLMFKASDDHVFVGSDYSQQEPRLLSMYSQDSDMIGAYRAGKDLYATIATGVYNNSYWDNMEHHEDGSPNPEGKKRRSNCKSLLLGRRTLCPFIQ